MLSGLPIAQGTAPCSESNLKGYVRRAVLHNQTLLIVMTSGWQDPEVHFDSSKKACCIWPDFMSC